MIGQETEHRDRNAFADICEIHFLGIGVIEVIGLAMPYRERRHRDIDQLCCHRAMREGLTESNGRRISRFTAPGLGRMPCSRVQTRSVVKLLADFEYLLPLRSQTNGRSTASYS